MMFDGFAFHECILEINADGRTQKSRISAPRAVIEAQFLHWVEQASRASVPVMVKLYHVTPNCDQKDSVSFFNPSYAAGYEEGDFHV